MTNTQLYLVIFVPVLLNSLITCALLGLLWAHFDTRFDSLNQRFDDMRELWRSELQRVEGVIDARLKHLEEMEGR